MDSNIKNAALTAIEASLEDLRSQEEVRTASQQSRREVGPFSIRREFGALDGSAPILRIVLGTLAKRHR